VATSLDISVVVSTYQRPQHLRRCLTSLTSQRGVSDKFEVLVADDGSQDETASMVAEFRKTAPFPLKFYTHPHDGFQLARCRNSGIRASVAPYILFTDGDCIFPPDHLRRHLDAREPGVARAGDCIRIDQATSERIDEEAIRSGRFLMWIDRREQKSLSKTYVKSLGYQFFRHRHRPKLTGWNMAIWRDDLELVNGFDEKFRGWGCEDDDLAARLRLSGVRIATALRYTHGYHLWHPPHSTTPQRWHEGPNVAYFQRPLVLPRCLEGIRSRSLSQVSTRVIGSDEQVALSRQLSNALRESTKGTELEVMIWPGRTGFTAKGARRVIIVPAGAPVSKSVDRMADANITLEPNQGASAALDALQRLLDGQDPAVTAATHRAA
jgi:glycosyltransferase involved in cell wall biosynthesis